MSEIRIAELEGTTPMPEVVYEQSVLLSIIHGSDDIQLLISLQAGEIPSAQYMPLLKPTGMKTSSNVCQQSKGNT